MTISQLGFMVAAVGLGAYVPATFHLITHAFFKALLFLASGSVIHGMEHGAVLTLAILVVVIVRLYPMIPADGALQSAPQVDPATLQSSVARLGRSFVSAEAYVLPFELASVLLLAALVGSIIIAWPRSGEEDSQ